MMRVQYMNMRIWSIILIKSNCKYCLHLGRFLFLYYITIGNSKLRIAKWRTCYFNSGGGDKLLPFKFDPRGKCPPQRRQGPDLRPLWLLVGTPSAIRPELASRRAEHGPKSVRNRSVIELFCGVVCVVILPFWHFCWCKGFCHRTESDIFLFLPILYLSWF